MKTVMFSLLSRDHEGSADLVLSITITVIER